MAIINDTDLLVVQRGGENYTYSGAELKDDMRLYGSGGSAPTPSLAQVCAVGSDYNGTITVDDLNVDNKISCKEIGATSKVESSGTVLGSTVQAVTNLKGPSGFLVDNRGFITSVASYGQNPGGKEMMCNGSGYIGVKTTFRRSAATNITPVDTSNFINVLKAVNLNRADLTVSDGVRPEIGLFVEDIQSTAAASILTHLDNSTVEFSSTNYEHFLFGVCQKQQELIESLTTRIEQLEVNHVDY